MPTVQVQETSPATWAGKAGDIYGILTRLAIPSGGKKALYNPLPLVFSPGRLSVKSQSDGRTSFVIGEVEQTGITSSGAVTVDVVHILEFLGLYDATDDVTITFGDPITIASTTRTCTVHPDAVMAPDLGSAVPAFGKDGIVQYKSGPATTIAAVNAEVLQGVVKDGKTIECATFPINARTDGLRIELGGLEAKKNAIKRFVPTAVTGPEVSTVIGEDLALVLAHAIGSVQLQLKEKHPLIVVAGGVRYVLMPRAVS